MSINQDPFIQNQKLGRGVNIIGYDPTWKDKTKARFSDSHLKKIKEVGFDHVRINLHPFKFCGVEPQYQLSSQFFDTLDWAIDVALSYDLQVIIDLHEFNSMAKNLQGLKVTYFSVWNQLSHHYRNYPESVFFELLNEPHGDLHSAAWNELAKLTLDLVRIENPNRTVILGPANWNGIEQLSELTLPEADRNIIVTVHFYHPMEFTHQGAPWSTHGNRIGVQWQDSEAERNLLVKKLAVAEEWALAHNRPIFLGEFGAYDKGDMTSRARYTAFIARQAESYGWSWSYWQFDSDFILYDIDNDQWVEPILRALIPKGT